MLNARWVQGLMCSTRIRWRLARENVIARIIGSHRRSGEQSVKQEFRLVYGPRSETVRTLAPYW